MLAPRKYCGAFRIAHAGQIGPTVANPNLNSVAFRFHGLTLQRNRYQIVKRRQGAKVGNSGAFRLNVPQL